MGRDISENDLSAEDVSDAQLIRFAQKGDVEAFARLYQRYRDSLMNICIARLGRRSLAEDAVQDTFLRAWINIGKIEPRNVSSWLTTIAVNRCTDFQRRESRVTSLDFLEEILQNPSEKVRSCAEEVIDAVDKVELEQALMSLLPRQRRALILYAEGWNYGEIADAENVSLSAVKSRLLRARKAIRSAWGKGSAPIFVSLRWARFKAGEISASIDASGAGIFQSFAAVASGIAITALIMAAGLYDGVYQGIEPARAIRSEGSMSEARPIAVSQDRQPAAVWPALSPETGQDRPENILIPAQGTLQELVDPTQDETPETVSFWSLTPSPQYTTDHTVYAAGLCGTNPRGSDLLGCRILFSTNDAGGSWRRLESQGLWGEKILLPSSHPEDRRIFALAPGGFLSPLQQSDDGGRSFRPVGSPFNAAAAISPAFNRGDPRILLGGRQRIYEYRADTGIIQPANLSIPRTSGIAYQSIVFSPGYPSHPVILLSGQMDRLAADQVLSWAGYLNLLMRCDLAHCEETVIPARGDVEIRVPESFTEDGLAWVFTQKTLLKYFDGDRTFQKISIPPIVWYISDFAPPATGDRSGLIYLAARGRGTEGGLFVGDDGGSWRRLPIDVAGFEEGVARVTSLPNGRILASGFNRGIACSIDLGLTWAQRC